MKKILYIIIPGVMFPSYKHVRKEVQKNINTKLTFTERLEDISDSIKVGDIVIKNLFKSQNLQRSETFPF